MQQPYYVKEKPVEVITEFGEFRYYKEAGKLQVSRPKWKQWTMRSDRAKL